MTAQPIETATKIITGAELLAMGDIGPCELIDGVIVRMSPTGGVHAFLESRLDRRLGVFIDDAKIGLCMVGEIGINIRHDPDRIRGADLAFWSNAKLPDGPPPGFIDVAPDLVVEIFSPTDRWAEMNEKIEDYFSIGVGEVWIVEPEGKTVFVYRSVTQRTPLRRGDTLTGSGSLTDFRLPVDELFAF